MDKATITKALKTRYRDLGLSDKALDGVASFIEPSITEDSQLDNAVGGVEAMLKALQSDADTERTAKAAAEKRAAELEARIKAFAGDDAKPGEGGAEAADGKRPDDIPAWAKTLLDSNRSLAERLDKAEGAKLAEDRRGAIGRLTAKLPEGMRKAYERTPVEGVSDEEFAKLTADIAEEVKGLETAAKARGSVFGSPLPGGGRTGDDLTKEQLAAIAKRDTPGGKDQPF